MEVYPIQAISNNDGVIDRTPRTIKIGSSCELNAPIRISYYDAALGDFDFVKLPEYMWKEGKHELPGSDGDIILVFSDRSDVCSILGEDNASSAIIVSITFVVIIFTYLIYLKARTYLYDIDEYIRLEKGFFVSCEIWFSSFKENNIYYA